MAEHSARESLRKIRHTLRLDKIHPLPRKVIVGIVGGIFLVAGIVMLITPGPAFIFIPLGLFLLATEFKWAERWAHRVQSAVHKTREKWRERKRRRAAQAKP